MRRFGSAVIVLAAVACRPAQTAPTEPTPAPAPVAVAETDAETDPIGPALEPWQPPPEPEMSPDDPADPEPASEPPPTPTLTNPATFRMLVANERVRKSPLGPDVQAIFDVAPDFAFQRGGLDALHDVDYLLVASPDIRDQTQTLTIAQHKLARAELEGAIDRQWATTGQTVHWTTRGGHRIGDPRPTEPADLDRDPRVFVELDKGTIVFGRRALVAGDSRATAPLQRALKRFIRRDKTTGMSLELLDLRTAKSNLPVPIPDSIKLTIRGAKKPKITIKLEFAAAGDAAAAARFWRVDVAKYIEDHLVAKVSVGWIYKTLSVRETSKSVRLEGRFEIDQMRVILKLFGGQLAKLSKMSPDDVERAKRAREEAWKRRKSGKLPPSAGVAPLPPT